MDPRVLQSEALGEGDPVILVPGALTGWLSWIPHAERLATSRKAIRVQPIGNELGSAGKVGDPSYSMAIERESFRMTLDALGVERADLAGWSGGGRALIEFALEYPDRVRTLTLVEPAAYWVLYRIGEFEPEPLGSDFIESLAGRDVSEDDLAQFLAIAGFAEDGTDPRSHPNWDRWVPHRNALSWQFPALADSPRTIEELHSIVVPTLLVKGTVTTDWEKRVVDALGARLPNATVLELEGDHACHIQSIDDFMVAFEKHIAR